MRVREAQKKGDGSLVVDRTEKFQSRFEFSFRVVGLDNGRYHGDVNVLGADVVGRRDFSDVDVWKNETDQL